jgi:hypothetical protein
LGLVVFNQLPRIWSDDVDKDLLLSFFHGTSEFLVKMRERERERERERDFFCFYDVESVLSCVISWEETHDVIWSILLRSWDMGNSCNFMRERNYYIKMRCVLSFMNKESVASCNLKKFWSSCM